MFAAQRLDFCQVVQRKWLPADEVCPRFHPDKSDAACTVLLHYLPQFVDIHVPFEWIGAGNAVCLVDGCFHHTAAAENDMGLGGRKVIIHGHDSAGFDKNLGQDMFAGSALVSREEILRSKQFRAFGFQPGEGLGTGVAVVGFHHRRQLPVAHGVHTAVGEHVQIDVAVFQQKCVAARVLHSLQAFFDRKQA